MPISITNASADIVHISIPVAATTLEYDVPKRYATLSVSEPILTVRWHLYELDRQHRELNIDYTLVNPPVAASATALAVIVQGYIDTIFGGGGGSFDPTTITGWDANNPDLILQPVGDGSANLIWRQSA